VNFSSATIEAIRKWHIFQVLKEKNCQLNSVSSENLHVIGQQTCPKIIGREISFNGMEMT